MIPSEAVTDVAIWRRSSSWVIGQAARGWEGVAPAVQIPGSMLALTTLIVETRMCGVESAP